ncbi:gas vesicle protein GvpA/GvpJ/GvpM family [Georgenia soli]|uniref:Gas vesicle protein GvpA/GvpJ/GvpM family n=1 Tax=Georgenia soli TaxID=638953 RepID=A0A2A9EL94_9MICO|nr:gas vesicle protein [Georgenia soli]PFG39366.1 gas vesicle protein GvpA/GvpJ/GvpM family [Georgenia soli]
MSVVAGRSGGLEPQRDRDGSLVHVIETLLDKGLVLNADIMVSVAGVELLGIRIRAALASFETAAKYGLEFPAGTNTETLAWRRAIEQKDTCPSCGKTSPTAQLLEEFCPWCGWRSAQAQRAAERTEVEGTGRGEVEGSDRSDDEPDQDETADRDDEPDQDETADRDDERDQDDTADQDEAADRAEVPDRDG